MESITRLIEWANANEGLLQGLAMIGGVGALLLSLRQQRSVITAGGGIGPSLPATLWVHPVGAEVRAAWGDILRSFGGRIEVADEVHRVAFSDASEAGRAALELTAGLDTRERADLLLLLTEPEATAPDLASAPRGNVRSSGAIRRSLADAPDLDVRRAETGMFPLLVSPTSRFRGLRRAALPILGIGLVAWASLSLLSK